MLIFVLLQLTLVFEEKNILQEVFKGKILSSGKDLTVFLIFWTDCKELSVLRLKNVSLFKILEVYGSI